MIRVSTALPALRAGQVLRVALPVIALVAAPIMLRHDFYWLNIVTLALIFAAASSSWNIISGLGGQFSLGHGVFFGVSGYAAAIGLSRHGVSPWLMLPAGMALAAIIALPVSLLTFRLRGPFFTIVTLALNQVAFGLAVYWKGMTDGAVGMSVPYTGGARNMVFSDPTHFGLLAVGYLLFVLAVVGWIRRHRLGYRLRAVKSDEEAARALGTHPTTVKVTGMVVSAALTAGSGTLFVMYVRVIDPPTVLKLTDVGARFALDAMIGGLGTLWGPVAGSFLVTVGQAWIRGEVGGTAPGLHLVVTGFVLVIAPLFFRRGIAGTANYFGAWVLGRIRGWRAGPGGRAVESPDVDASAVEERESVRAAAP